MVIDKHIQEFKALELGLHATANERAPYLAAFVDQISESIPGADSATLGKLESVGLPNSGKEIQRAIDELHKVRNRRQAKWDLWHALRARGRRPRVKALPRPKAHAQPNQ